MGANAEHRLGCVSGWAQKRRRPFFSKASTVPKLPALSRLALQRHNSSLSTDAPFYDLLVAAAVVNPQEPGAEHSCYRLAKQANAHCWG